MTKVRRPRAPMVLALLASFGAGVFVDGWLRTYGSPIWAHSGTKRAEAPADSMTAAAPRHVDRPSGRAAEPKMSAAPGADSRAPSATGLRVPIDGISIESLRGGFAERRASRPHEAVDIMAPRDTPVHAVQDGTIAKLFFSQAGGTTIYQFDLDGRFCYYYAHLGRYADLLHEGQHVSQGEVIGYVGTSGNAPPGTPHLHFAIFELNADQKWWQGRPRDPYLVFKEKGSDSTMHTTGPM